jgi:hypothetical protein
VPRKSGQRPYLDFLQNDNSKAALASFLRQCESVGFSKSLGNRNKTKYLESIIGDLFDSQGPGIFVQWKRVTAKTLSLLFE